MDRIELKDKPLVEALLEMRWRIGAQSGTDPHYQLLIGRLFDRLQDEYKIHVTLDSAQLPSDMAAQAGLVQHQLRPAPGEWPLVQLGPGVMTVNVTDKYDWPDFGPRCLKAVEEMFKVHPSADELRVTSMMLRYIDAVDFDCMTGDALRFLDEKLKFKVQLAPALFTDTGVSAEPRELDLSLNFGCEKPNGRVRLRFFSGTRKNSPALIWETIVVSRDADVPDMPDGFSLWLDAAHEITHDWFFKMIDGDLHRRFAGD